MPRKIDLEALCNEKGLRITEQRRVIARVLSEADDHPDVEKVYERASAIDPGISIATVYRTVRLFEEAGILDRHDFGDGRARYEPAPEAHHDHLIDVESGKVIEFVDPEILTRGLVSHEELYPPADQSDVPPELRKYPIPLAQKMRLLFESEIDHAGGLFVSPVWAVGDLLQHGGDFDKFVRARDLVKQALVPSSLLLKCRDDAVLGDHRLLDLQPSRRRGVWL